MGQFLSICHVPSNGDPIQKGVLLFRFNDDNYEPISFLNFLQSPTSFLENPILIFEPFENTSTICLVESPVKSLSYIDLKRVINTQFKITPFTMKNDKFWFLCSSQVSKQLKTQALNICRSFPFNQYTCQKSVDPNEIFSDLHGVSSLASALRPPSASIRASSPLRATGQISGKLNTLQVRHSHESTIQQTFMSPPVFPDLSVRCIISHDCDLVIERLYIGSASAANNRELLRSLKITHIINLSNETLHEPDIIYYTVPLNDSVFTHLDSNFWRALSFLKQTLDNGGTVLVHCRMGKSRSAALCVAYLMEQNQMTFDEAYTFLKEKRPSVDINPGFAEDLIAHEKQQNRKSVPPKLALKLNIMAQIHQ